MVLQWGMFIKEESINTGSVKVVYPTEIIFKR